MTENTKHTLKSFIRDTWHDHASELIVYTAYHDPFKHDLDNGSLHVGRYTNGAFSANPHVDNFEETLGTMHGPDDNDIPLYTPDGATRYTSHQDTLPVMQRNRQEYDKHQRLITPNQYHNAIRRRGLRHGSTGLTEINPDTPSKPRPEDTIVIGNAALEQRLKALTQPLRHLSEEYTPDEHITDALRTSAYAHSEQHCNPRYIRRETPKG